MTFLELKPLTIEQLAAAVELDQLCLGGLWTLEGYQRELESPNSDLLILVTGQQELQVAEGLPVSKLRIEDSIFQSSTPRPPDVQSSSLVQTTDNRQTVIGLGCLWAILEEAHITLLAIHPNYRRLGLGQLLLSALLQNAKQRQLEWATLEVRASNQVALSLYQKLDFQEVGRRRRYYKDTGEDALILWRSGLQDPEFERILEGWQQQASHRLASAGWQFIDTSDSFTNRSASGIRNLS